MADSDLIGVFDGLTLGLPPKTLQLEGGTVIMHLSDRLEDTLILHEDVLGSASDRFGVRFKSARWAPTREVVDDETGDRTNIFEYYLVYTDNTFSLTDEKEKAIQENSVATGNAAAARVPTHRGGRGGRGGRGSIAGGATRTLYAASFQSSELVTGFDAQTPFPGLTGPGPIQERRAASIVHHKILFALLYGLPCDTDFGSDHEILYALTEVAALADYYLLLPAVGDRIAAAIESVASLWESIAHWPKYYLLLGDKLHSFAIFSDALRHSSIGRTEVLQVVLEKQQELLRAIDNLTSSLRLLTLYPYQSHVHRIKRHRGAHTSTTWTAANLDKKSLRDICTYLANSIFREKLDALTYGNSHWSHVQHIRNGRTGGEVEAGSLYVACKAILAANKAPYKLDIFGKGIARQYAGIFNLRRTAEEDPARLIADELRSLLRTAVREINAIFRPGGNAAHYSNGEPAKYIKGIK